jgi:predicted TIM-barrel enzyme
MTSLYNITAQYRADLAALADLDVDPVTAHDTLEAIQGDIRDKLEAVIAYSLELDILADGAMQAAKRMQDRAIGLGKRVDWLRAYALQSMQATGIGEVSTDEFAAKVARKPASVVISEVGAIPADFLRVKTTTEPDKVALKKAIEGGAIIEGVTLQQGYRLAVQ